MDNLSGTVFSEHWMLYPNSSTLQVALMPDESNWPNYHIGPRDSVFALGVISVNYGRLERAVHVMLQTILAVDSPTAERITPQLSTESKDSLMRSCLPLRGWPSEIAELVRHFIDAHKILYENRNKLMHSAIVSGGSNATILYKTKRSGKAELVNPLRSELRQIADDMMTYYAFGIQMANMINFEILKVPPQPGDLAYETWPTKPPLPIPLEYSSDPLAIRADR